MKRGEMKRGEMERGDFEQVERLGFVRLLCEVGSDIQKLYRGTRRRIRGEKRGR
jgi:hypothetical protein